MERHNHIRILALQDDSVPQNVLRLTGNLEAAKIPNSVTVVTLEDTQKESQSSDEVTNVILGSKRDRQMVSLTRLRHQLSGCALVVLGGWELTFHARHLENTLGSNEALVCGDPEYTVSTLAKSERPFLGEGLRTITGQLWDPNDYVAPPAECAAGTHRRVLWRVGCNRVCGYCPFGYHLRKIYGNGDLIRTRTEGSIIGEVAQCVQSGAEVITLVADQAFHDDPNKNTSFVDVCGAAARQGRKSVTLNVGLASCDVARNAEIIRKASSSTRLYFRLNVDFTSPRLLTRFNSPSRRESHVEALRICHELDIPFKINYIFAHPLLTSDDVYDLCEFLRHSVLFFSHNRRPFGHYLFNDFFLTRLDADTVSPADPRLRSDLLMATPEARAQNFVDCISLFARSNQRCLSSVLCTRAGTAGALRVLDSMERLLASCPDERLDSNEVSVRVFLMELAMKALET
jgi:hypothetical protein